MPPRPRPWLIKALGPFNRTLMLGGIPVLRDIPLLNRLPVITGLTNITRYDFPKPDRERLSQVVAPHTAAFLTPNHPEFFTDWMLDKDICARTSPLTACWATHTIVNGMGSLAQKFWLANNLIAQIPGAGGKAGRDYSVEWANRGHGVLLHPEGTVGWHANHVGPLFNGAVEMAIEAREISAANGDDRPTYVVPIVWKLAFQNDVEPGLHRELDYIETNLKLASTDPTASPADRLAAIMDQLLTRTERDWNVTAKGHLALRRDTLEQTVSTELTKLLERYDVDPATDPYRAARRWVRELDKSASERKDARHHIKAIDGLRRFKPELYSTSEISQEEIAEQCKRIRSDLCKGTTRDSVHALMPRPVGPRTAHIRVEQPMPIPAGTTSEDAPHLVVDLRERMQRSLDKLLTSLSPNGPTYPNPFAAS